MELFNKNIGELAKLCSRYHVFNLYVFGSATNTNFNKESDIDLLVSFNPVELIDYADNYFDLKFSLENLYKRKVDLLEEKTIKNPYLKQSIDSSKELLYG